MGIYLSKWPLALGFALLLAACSGDDAESEPLGRGVGETIELTSAAFGQGSTIPRQYTCDGADLSPLLVAQNARLCVQTGAGIYRTPENQPPPFRRASR